MIVIIDYNMGNLGSIKNMLRKIGHNSEITSDKEVIKNATKLILPGVGAFDTGMQFLKKLDLIGLLNERVIEEKIPVLGICLGAQLMTSGSDEGVLDGLNWFDAEVLSFKTHLREEDNLPVPNMGWRDVYKAKESTILENLAINPRYYFVHSYFIKAKDNSDILFKSQYGFDYAAGLERSNMIGVQFHPEKSHKFGFQLLKNFAEKY